jgi:hypothetical protein
MKVVFVDVTIWERPQTTLSVLPQTSPFSCARRSDAAQLHLALGNYVSEAHSAAVVVTVLERAIEGVFS